jgi:hypothetical protein
MSRAGSTLVEIALPLSTATHQGPGVDFEIHEGGLCETSR